MARNASSILVVKCLFFQTQHRQALQHLMTRIKMSMKYFQKQALEAQWELLLVPDEEFYISCRHFSWQNFYFDNLDSSNRHLLPASSYQLSEQLVVAEELILVMVEEQAVVLPIADVVVELVHEKKADFVVGMVDVEEHIEIVDKAAEWALEHIAVEKVA